MSSNIDTARAKLVDEVRFDILTATQEVDNEAQRKSIARNFVSDTITAPTQEMYLYAIKAGLGDDVYHEATTASLEAHIAKLTGKEAALFMTSGTLSNQVALRTHLQQPPYSILCDERAHVNKYEAGGAAFHSGASLTTVKPANGLHITLEEVKTKMILGENIHVAPTKVVELENTLNGTIFPQNEIIAISEYAHSIGAKMHLDGARLWHVAAETGTSLNELCDPFDSVALCFSKGLGAPIGSCLVGSKEFIRKARWFRKLFGSAMRNIGFLSACMAYALTHHFPQLPRVHAMAKRLENGLEQIGASILSKADTCMVFYDPSSLGLSYDEISERGSQLENPITLSGERLVVHIQTSDEAIDDLLELIRDLAEVKRKAGWVRPENATANGQANGDIYYARNTLKKD